MANYPGSVPSSSPATHTVVNDEIVAIATELGTNPKGSFADVKARLDALAADDTAANFALPTGAIADTMDRRYALSNTLAALSTGRLSMTAIGLETGVTITSITVVSGTTAAVTPTNQIFGLYDSSRNLLRATSNNTTTAWGASTARTLNLTSTYLTTSSGLYYIGCMVTAGTVPTLQGSSSASSSLLGNAVTPIMSGTSSTGLTTSLPNPAAALTSSGIQFYAYVS